jgi:hypothetical protein
MTAWQSISRIAKDGINIFREIPLDQRLARTLLAR